MKTELAGILPSDKRGVAARFVGGGGLIAKLPNGVKLIDGGHQLDQNGNIVLNEYGYPRRLIRLDSSEYFADAIRESEQRCREAIEACDALGPCVLILDDSEED